MFAFQAATTAQKPLSESFLDRAITVETATVHCLPGTVNLVTAQITADAQFPSVFSCRCSTMDQGRVWVLIVQHRQSPMSDDKPIPVDTANGLFYWSAPTVEHPVRLKLVRRSDGTYIVK
jgi:hypothetical protein